MRQTNKYPTSTKTVENVVRSVFSSIRAYVKTGHCAKFLPNISRFVASTSEASLLKRLRAALDLVSNSE